MLQLSAVVMVSVQVIINWTDRSSLELF